mmetsp:Transcript_27635/g.67217  ORF Transcript_27635/g.67217 Transcript_27635/m.67217 type:complete len:428 (-) Transcript_27635:87-1370(-)|eukprot:CAMPEP_0113639112 /NCGR_PEP_ID=MMETSP0017_2-20120614/20507_1 /TAXON_ID=2856 /ORGANISM="Cylindrotheca closterium" /LENGTH=427 /DNA_ID=CAMNT_0000550287 /DNA_START=172 /DNA_END=1455 /DNA_ORIENTATION=+ /assembly_acc=CAM_ASM_000147
MMTHQQNHKFLQFSLLFLLFSSLVQGQSQDHSSLRRALQEESTWRDTFSNFFTDERCLRTEKNTASLKDLSNWMSKRNSLNATRLLDITLPGTHNSAAFDLTTELNVNDPDYSTVEKGTFKIPDAVISQWICGYALTQSLSLSEQLQAGARYLDLRMDYDVATSTWRGYHFLWGLEMSVLLEQIATFAKAHPKEIIVLQFGTIYNTGVTAEQKQDYANMITNAFAGQLMPTTTDLPTAMIGELQEAGTTIMAIVRDNEIATMSDVLWDEQTAIENTYAPTDNVDALKSYNEDRLADFYKLGANNTELYKLQWILTPSVEYIQKNPLVGNLYELAQDANGRLVEFKRPSSDANQQLGNILLIDYVEVSPLFDVLDLQQYSDGAFIEEAVPEQDKFSAAAKIGLGVGLTMFICGLCCLRKWCKGSKNKD